ncbi:MAG: hypothetical protein WCX73_05190, partial [Candidatus Pacearchaeota archaeon]
MGSEFNPFIFKEHVFQVEDPSEDIFKLEESLQLKRNFLFRPFLRKRLEELKKFKSDSYERHNLLDYFFQKTSENKSNDLKYYPNGLVWIEGTGNEIFKCNGKPTFERIGEKEISNIPVKIGREESVLILPKHPQVDFSPWDNFEVNYTFRTFFDLPSNGSSAKASIKFKKYCPDKNKIYYTDRNFVGKEIDRMFNLTPMGSSLFEYHPERFKLSGKITIQNTNEL